MKNSEDFEFGKSKYAVTCEFPTCEEKTEVTDATSFMIEDVQFVFCPEHSFQAVERGYKNWGIIHREEKE